MRSRTLTQVQSMPVSRICVGWKPQCCFHAPMLRCGFIPQQCDNSKRQHFEMNILLRHQVTPLLQRIISSYHWENDSCRSGVACITNAHCYICLSIAGLSFLVLESRSIWENYNGHVAKSLLRPANFIIRTNAIITKKNFQEKNQVKINCLNDFIRIALKPTNQQYLAVCDSIYTLNLYVLQYKITNTFSQYSTKIEFSLTYCSYL